MMKTGFTAALLAAALSTSGGVAYAEEESLTQWWFSPWRHKEVQPATDKIWNEECGSCHLAYQPGLLPSRSWEKLLTETALADHFGDDASLDAETLKELRGYALANAADKSYHKRSRKIALATETGDAPLRITDVRYIKRKHHEIPEKMLKGNKDVKSLSHCNKCHTKAEDGNYDNDTVAIPNYPDWED